MKSFSQRKGIVPVVEIIQIDSMSDDLRNSLWNVLDRSLWSSENFMRKIHGASQMEEFSQALWFHHFKKPIDSRPEYMGVVHRVIRDVFFSCKWNEVYDFLEFVVHNRERQNPELAKALNIILERELSGYRIISGRVVDITSEQEVKMLDEALNDTQFAGVAAHLQRAMELFSDREQPDYRNSIKESISAVESMARIITGDTKATLGAALNTLAKENSIHPALTKGFTVLYGYTSDEQGIRHSMLDEPNITTADAKFFLLSCTSFTNYLKTHLSESN
jgi:AbiJ N-terminal domain 4